ncbi:MAG: hypothetical protein AAB449_01550 [Patescibacteria group bacterium]
MPYKSLFIAFSIAIIAFITIGSLVLWFIWPDSFIPRTITQSFSGEEQSDTAPVAAAPIPTIDSDALYAALFAKLGATKVDFAQISSANNNQYSSVFALYAQDVADYKKLFPQSPSPALGIAFKDLNGDVVSDAIVYENLSGIACGSAGCAVEVYRKQGNTWNNILSTLGSDIVGVADSKTSGFNDLFISTDGEAGAVLVVKYVWNGSRYERSSTAAIWNGSTFIVR